MNANYPAFADPAWYQQQAAAQQAAAQQAAAVALAGHAISQPHAADAATLQRINAARVANGMTPLAPAPGSAAPTWGVVATDPTAPLPAPTGQAFGPITNLPAQTAPLLTGTLNPDQNASGGTTAATGLTSMQTAIVIGVAGVSAYYLWQSMR